MLQVDQDSDGNTVLACPYVEPGCLYPEEVSACIVQQLLEDAAQHTGVPAITKAVITVPAYFDDKQRDATIAAGACTTQPGVSHQDVQCSAVAKRSQAAASPEVACAA